MIKSQHLVTYSLISFSFYFILGKHPRLVMGKRIISRLNWTAIDYPPYVSAYLHNLHAFVIGFFHNSMPKPNANIDLLRDEYIGVRGPGPLKGMQPHSSVCGLEGNSTNTNKIDIYQLYSHLNMTYFGERRFAFGRLASRRGYVCILKQAAF